MPGVLLLVDTLKHYHAAAPYLIYWLVNSLLLESIVSLTSHRQAAVAFFRNCVTAYAMRAARVADGLI